MVINCVWEHNGKDTLLYAVDYFGAYTRGESLEIAKTAAAEWALENELCPDFHGKGYGKQILNAFLSFAFDELGATELHYDCFKQNEVSKHLAISCGFTYTYSEEAELMKDGERVILDYYEVRK